MAGRIHFVHDACVRRAAEKSCSIEVAGRVADHSGPGNVSISARQSAREGEQHSLMAGRIQLVYDARARRAAENSSSIEVAGRVEDHSGCGFAPIGPAREAVEDLKSVRMG